MPAASATVRRPSAPCGPAAVSFGLASLLASPGDQQLPAPARADSRQTLRKLSWLPHRPSSKRRTPAPCLRTKVGGAAAAGRTTAP